MAECRSIGGKNRGFAREHLRRSPVGGTMGYIVVLILLVVAVPLLFVIFSRRPGGSGPAQHDRGMTVAEPSSDQPSPGASRAGQRLSPEAERRLPPG